MTSTSEPTIDDLSEDAREVLRGAIDIHVHADPDPYAARKLDARATVAAARAAGLAGIVLKSHEYPTQPLAWALGGEIDGIDVYGGVALDWGVGGVNPDAVDISLRIGARAVWMPTFDAQHWREYRPGQVNSVRPGITILDADGALVPECHTILDLIREHDAVLASGHLSPRETDALVSEALGRGIRSVITHASFWTPVELQREIAAKGGWIEQCAIAVAGDSAGDWPDVLAQVQALGPERVILSSDHGQASNPEPVVALGLWAQRFLDAGIPLDAVGQMLRENPRSLLG